MRGWRLVVFWAGMGYWRNKFIFGPAVNFISVRLLLIMSNKTRLIFSIESFNFRNFTKFRNFSNKF